MEPKTDPTNMTTQLCGCTVLRGFKTALPKEIIPQGENRYELRCDFKMGPSDIISLSDRTGKSQTNLSKARIGYPLIVRPSVQAPISHICMLRPKTETKGNMAVGIFVNYDDRIGINQGPYIMPKPGKWYCIPLVRTSRVVDIRVINVKVAHFADVPLTLSRIILLTPKEVSESFTNWGLSTRVLTAVSDKMFFGSCLTPSCNGEYDEKHAEAFLRAFPPDIVIDSSKDVRAHSMILKARRSVEGPLDFSIVEDIPLGVKVRAVSYLYTGNLARLAGWFGAASESMIGENLGTVKYTLKKTSSGNILDQGLVKPLILMGGALPFYIFALRMGFPSLRAACEEYAVGRLNREGSGIEDYISALKFAELVQSPFLANLVLQLAIIQPFEKEEFESHIPPQFSRQYMLTQLLVAGKDEEEKMAEARHVVHQILPGAYSGRTKTSSASLMIDVPRDNIGLAKTHLEGWKEEIGRKMLVRPRPEIRKVWITWTSLDSTHDTKDGQEPAPKTPQVRWPMKLRSCEESLNPLGFPDLHLEVSRTKHGDLFTVWASDMVLAQPSEE